MDNLTIPLTATQVIEHRREIHNALVKAINGALEQGISYPPKADKFMIKLESHYVSNNFDLDIVTRLFREYGWNIAIERTANSHHNFLIMLHA